MVHMGMRFVPVALALLFLIAGCISQNNAPQAANIPSPIFQSADSLRLNKSEIPSGYALDIETFSDADMVKMSPGSDYLGIGLPLQIRTDVYRAKNEYALSSAPNISSLKDEMKKNGISEELNSSVSGEISRLPPHGWARFVLGKSSYLVKYNESGSFDLYRGSNKGSFLEKISIYPAENASRIMQKDIAYVNGLSASANWSISGLQTLQFPNGAIAYLVESKPAGSSAAFHVDQAIGNAFVKISVVTNPENPDPSGKAFAISIAQLVANKSKADIPA